MATDTPAAADAAAGSRAAPRAAAAGHVHGHALSNPVGKDLAKLSLGALGVVYGDIGTSPLYALRECFHGPHAVDPTRPHVFGVLSLVFWALVIVIVIKYLSFIMRADNRGEGGILALAALVMGTARARRISAVAIPVLMGLFGAGLLYGEGLITPAISILGAMEGLEVATDSLAPLVVPITAGILVGLFAVQRYGTGRIGAIFALLGCIVFVAAHAVSLIFRDARVDDPEGLAAIALFLLGTLCSAGGFIVAGVAVVRAGRWTSWRRYSVLPVGIWMLCIVPLQFTPLLPLTVAVYAATVSAFAVALLAEPESR